jgi:hypothetical protein
MVGIDRSRFVGDSAIPPIYPQSVSDADLGIKESFEGSDYSVVDDSEWVDLQVYSEISRTD